MELEDVEMYREGNFSYMDNGTYTPSFVNCQNITLPLVYIVIQVLYALVCVIGLLGNTLVIYVVLRYSKMQTVTNMYIVNLAIADECFLIGLQRKNKKLHTMENDYLRSKLHDKNLATFAHCSCAEKSRNREVLQSQDPGLKSDPNCKCAERKLIQQFKVDNHQPCTYPLIYEQSESNGDESQRIRGPPGDAVEQRPRYIAPSSTHRLPLLGSFSHVLAQFVVPIVNFNNAIRWGCPPSNLLNATDTLYYHLEMLSERIWCRFRGFAWENMARELYATVIDLILIIYAFGFIVISLYESAIIT